MGRIKFTQIKYLGLFLSIFSLLLFVFSSEISEASYGTLNYGGVFPITMNYSGVTPGGCDNGSESPSFSIDATNTTNYSYTIQTAAFHSNISGCGPYSGDNASGMSISGMTEFPAKSSGHFDVNYDASSYTCGRVQYDVSYINNVTGENTVFIGQVINYGVDCSNPPPPSQNVCTENSSVSVISPLPEVMTPGQKYSFTMRVSNTGDTRWYHGSYFQFIEKSGNLTIDPSYGHLPYGVYPGDYVDWTFNVTAPSVSGNYSADIQMIHRAGAEYIKPDGSTCVGPSTNTYFGGIGSVSSSVVPVSNFTLTINKIGNGTGVVSGAGSYSAGTVVNATATASIGSVFTGWGGDCSTNGDVVMNANKICTANFSLTPISGIAVSLNANPNSITLPMSSTTLSWTTTGGPATCTASGAWSGSKSVSSGSEVITGLTTGTHMFRLTCSKPGTDDMTSFVSVLVLPSQAPTVNFVANPANIFQGESSTLTWVSTNATSCTASGDWSGTKTLSGSEIQNNLNSNKSYTIACTGLGGTATSTATVTVQTEPTNTCTIPDSIGDSAPIIFGESIDHKPLSGIISDAGILVSGQRGYQTWHNNKASTTIEVTFVKGFTSANDVFGYYKKGQSGTTFVPLFVNGLGTSTVYSNVSRAVPGQKYTIDVPSGDIGFAIYSEFNGNNNYWVSEKNLNLNQEDHVVAYDVLNSDNPNFGSFVLGFEDLALPNSDRDYNDVVVKIKIKSCDNPNVLPTVNLTANPASVLVGSSSILNWTSTNATSCTASGDWSGTKTLSGSEIQNNLNSNKSYTIACTGLGGTATSTATVIVTSIPTTSSNLSIQKSVDKSTANVGDTLIYTIKLVNNGPDNATGVTVTDLLDPRLSFVSASSTQGNYATTTGIWNVGNLNNTASTTLTLVTTIKDNSQGQNIPNTATTTATESDPAPGDNTSTTTVTVNNIVPMKGKITFCLMIADQNNVIATSSNGLPAGTFSINLATSTNISSSTIDSKNWNSDSFSPNRVIINGLDSDCVTFSNLPLGTYYYSQLSVNGSRWQIPKYNDMYNQSINNIFDFFPYSPELFNATTTDDVMRNLNSDGQITLVSGNTERTLVILDKFTIAPTASSNLSIQKSVDKSTANVGDTLIYTIKLVNNGPDNATGVTVTDLLDPRLSFVSASSTQGNYAMTTGIWNVGNLNNTASTTLTLVTTIKDNSQGQNIPNTATTTATESDPTPGDNTSTTTVTVNNIPPVCVTNCTPSSADVGVVKTVNKSNANTGDTITYSITVSNIGPNNASGVSVTDILPNSLNFVSATSTVGTYATSTGIWTIGNLNNASSTILTIVATIKDGFQGQTISNNATISAIETDPIPNNNSSTVNVSVNTPPPPVCVSNCGGTTGGGGNGPIVQNNLYIFNEQVVETVPGIALITWNTNVPATRRVVYGNNSTTTASAPNYGYENSTEFISTPFLTAHGMVVKIDSNKTYYFRAVSTDTSHTAVSKELTITRRNVSTGGESPNTCYYLHDYLRKDFNNNPVEVKKLQIFLRDLEGFSNLQVTGIYDDATINAVNAFQIRYGSDVLTPWGYTGGEGTDYTYILTKKKVNEIYCKMAFPVNAQQQKEIDAHRTFFESLRKENINVQWQNVTEPVDNENNIPIQNNVVGQATTSESTSTSEMTTLAGVSTTTKNIVSNWTANVISAGENVASLMFSVIGWPFAKNTTSNSCTNGFEWINFILLLIIAVILYMWYKERKSYRKIEEINKEIDLK